MSSSASSISNELARTHAIGWRVGSFLSTIDPLTLSCLLNLLVSDPPTQAEVQSIATKLDELIAALRR